MEDKPPPCIGCGKKKPRAKEGAKLYTFAQLKERFAIAKKP